VSTLSLHVAVECPICEAPGSVYVTMERLRGRWSVYDNEEPQMGCVCLDNASRDKYGRLRDQLVDRAIADAEQGVAA